MCFAGGHRSDRTSTIPIVFCLLALSLVPLCPWRDCDCQARDDQSLAPRWVSGVLALAVALAQQGTSLRLPRGVRERLSHVSDQRRVSLAHMHFDTNDAASFQATTMSEQWLSLGARHRSLAPSLVSGNDSGNSAYRKFLTALESSAVFPGRDFTRELLQRARNAVSDAKPREILRGNVAIPFPSLRHLC